MQRQKSAKSEQDRRDRMRAQEEGDRGGIADDEMGAERTPTQSRADKRRRAEIWAADYIETAEGKAHLCQPCEFPLRDRIPFGVKPAVVGAFNESMVNLQAATRERIQQPDSEVARKRVIGAWVTVLRLFPHAILRDQATTSKGGKPGEADVAAPRRDHNVLPEAVGYSYMGEPFSLTRHWPGRGCKTVRHQTPIFIFSHFYRPNPLFNYAW